MLIFSARNSYGQCTVQKRVYANRTETAVLLASISNKDNAVNGNKESYSTLNLPLGALNALSATQFLEFREANAPKNIPANTPVTLKLSLPKSVLGLLDDITIQPFTNLNKPSFLLPWTATNAGTAFKSAALLNLINGAGVVEITITPTVSYQGVYVKLSSSLGVSINMDLFHAYIYEENTSTAINCDEKIDALYGVRASAAIGLLNATGTVTDPYKAIDNDLNSFAELNLGIQVLSEVFETVIFSTPSQKNDVVEIILQKADGTLLDLNLLTNFSIQPYLGANVAGPSLTNASNFLSLSLLSGGSGNAKYLLNAKIPEIFDRVEIKMGGVAGVLSSLKIYDVTRKISPSIQLDDIEISNINVCSGESITLKVPSQPCTEFKWYDVPTSGTALQTGESFTINNITTTKTYYVEAKRNTVCNITSERVPVTITVNPKPGITLGTMPEVCETISQGKFSFSNPINSPTSYKIIWNQAALDAGFLNIEQSLPGNSEIQISVPANTAPAIYSGELTVKNANNCVSTAQSIGITIKPTPQAPILNIQTHSQY